MSRPAVQPPVTQYFQHAGGRLAYDDQGEGPLIVAVPGLGYLCQTDRLLAPTLVSAGYRVVTLDPRGQGESDARWPEFSPMALGDDVGAPITPLGAGHFGAGLAVLIGNSYSGGAAAWTAVQTSAGQRLMLKAMTSGPWKISAWTAYFATLFKGRRPAAAAAYRARLNLNLREPGRYAALQATLQQTRAPIEARLGEVRVPTLVMLGRADPDFPGPVQAATIQEAKVIAEALHGDDLMLERPGHCPQVERPHVTRDAPLRFLQADHHGA